MSAQTAHLRRLDEVVSSYTAKARDRFGDRLVSVVLFGSCARGAATASSDVDLLVVAEGLPLDRWDRQEINIRLSAELEPLLDDVVRVTRWYPYLSVIMETPEEARRFHRIYLDMVEEARVLHDRDGFFTSVLDSVKGKIAELGAKRIQVGDRWYWDLMPDFKPGKVIDL